MSLDPRYKISRSGGLGAIPFIRLKFTPPILGAPFYLRNQVEMFFEGTKQKKEFLAKFDTEAIWQRYLVRKPEFTVKYLLVVLKIAMFLEEQLELLETTRDCDLNRIVKVVKIQDHAISAVNGNYTIYSNDTIDLRRDEMVISMTLILSDAYMLIQSFLSNYLAGFQISAVAKIPTRG